MTADVDARLPDADLDDGVTFSALYASFQASTQVSVTNTTGSQAYVSMWIDFNADGFFSSSEQIADGLSVGAGTTALTFLVPSSATRGETYARVRLSTDRESIRSPLGPAPDGEVEDWKINILSSPFTNPSWDLDVNADGRVSSIDVLQVINWLNNPANPRELSLSDATFAPPFVDVNQDGRVSALDALLIINYLNTRPPSGGEGELSGEGEASGEAWLAGGSSMVSNAEQSFTGSPGMSANSVGQQMVLPDDWARGLFHRDSGRSEMSSSRFHQTQGHSALPVDLALADEDEELAIGVHGERVQQSRTSAVWAQYADNNGKQQLESHLVDDLLEDLFPIA